MSGRANSCVVNPFHLAVAQNERFEKVNKNRALDLLKIADFARKCSKNYGRFVNCTTFLKCYNKDIEAEKLSGKVLCCFDVHEIVQT